jgi:D-glycero-D-manno-heptose 1,7-bisphosphate phosphatase
MNTADPVPPDRPRPAVFLDRDGTLNEPVVVEGRPYPPSTVDALVLYPDAREACRSLAAAGFVLVVATNQPDVGRGTAPLAVVEAQHARLRELVPEIARIEVSYDSGHGPDEAFPRRKPSPGMLLDAAAALGLDLARSWMVGDRWRDVDCGHRAGVRTVFIDRGYNEALRARPDYVASSFAAAVEIILRQPRVPEPPTGARPPT